MPSLSGWDLEPYRAILRAHAMDVGMKIGAREDPSDIVQETLARVLASPEPFLGEKREQKIAWLLQVQKNVFIDKLREHRAGKRDLSLEAAQQKLDESTAAWIEKAEAEQTSPSAQAANREERSLLDKAIEKLPDREREAIHLHLREGLSMSDIAKQLGTTKGAVAGLIARASARLAADLKQE